MATADDVLPTAEAVEETKVEGDALPFDMEDEKLIVQLSEWFKEAVDAKSPVQKERKIDWRMYANDQWEDGDAKSYDDAKRPRLTMNMVLSIVSAVEGEERNNRQEIKFYGREESDDGGASGLNKLLRWITDNSAGQFALSRQFRSGIAVGEGWIVPEVDYFDDPNGVIKLDEVDDDECFPDPLDTSADGAKGRYFNRVKPMTMEEGEARWPGFKDKVTNHCIANGMISERDASGFKDIYSTPNDTKSPKMYDAQRKLWTVIETWWSQIEPGWIVVNEQTGLLEEKTPTEFEEMKAARLEEQRTWMTGLMQPPPPIATPMGPMPAPRPPMPPAIKAIQRPIRRYYQAFWSYGSLLAKQASPLPKLKRFPYVPFRALFDKVKKEWFGIIRSIRDPQRQHNIEQSIIVQLMQLMPKQSWMAPKGAYHNKQEWQEGVSKPGKMLEYNSSRGKPEAIQAAAIPRHMIDMAFSRPQSMREISGVNIELTGSRQGSDAGVVMEQRRKAALTVLAPIFDNFRQSKMALGRVLLAYIQAYVTPGRRVRVLGPEGESLVSMTEQMGQGEYDLTVDETSATVNDRIATLNIMQTTMPALAKAGIPIPPELIDIMPIEPHIREAWKRQILWTMTIGGQLPPIWWQPGMDPNAPPMPGAPGAPGDAAMPPSQPMPSTPEPSPQA